MKTPFPTAALRCGVAGKMRTVSIDQELAQVKMQKLGSLHTLVFHLTSQVLGAEYSTDPDQESVDIYLNPWIISLRVWGMLSILWPAFLATRHFCRKHYAVACAHELRHALQEGGLVPGVADESGGFFNYTSLKTIIRIWAPVTLIIILFVCRLEPSMVMVGILVFLIIVAIAIVVLIYIFYHNTLSERDARQYERANWNEWKEIVTIQ